MELDSRRCRCDCSQDGLSGCGVSGRSDTLRNLGEPECSGISFPYRAHAVIAMGTHTIHPPAHVAARGVRIVHYGVGYPVGSGVTVAGRGYAVAVFVGVPTIIAVCVRRSAVAVWLAERATAVIVCTANRHKKDVLTRAQRQQMVARSSQRAAGYAFRRAS
jgi:hypothetical protein